VNRQIKSALHVHLKKLIPEALLELDGRLRHQKKEAWASCLCALLLFCTCIEQIQVVADAFILSNLSSEGGDPAPIRQRGLDICNGLEERTLEHMQLLLDGMLKGIIKKYGPFRAVVRMEGEGGLNEVGLSEEEIILTNELQQIADEHSEFALYRSKMAANVSQTRRLRGALKTVTPVVIRKTLRIINCSEEVTMPGSCPNYYADFAEYSDRINAGPLWRKPHV
jgi:hypothetical protein